MDLVIIGSSNMDMVISLPHIPSIGETVSGGKSTMVFGGKGANQAVAASRAGCKVAFITKLGNDIFGENLRSHFNDEGLPSKYILTDIHEPTGIAQIFVSEKGENSIGVALGANMTLSPLDIMPFEEVIKKAKVVLLQLETPLETVEYIANLDLPDNVKVVLNPAPAQKLGADLLKKIWLLTPNESEASLLTGIKVIDVESAIKAGERLLQTGVKNVIITLGENGCLLYNENGFKHYKANKVDVVDTTAAGDVFNGTIAAAITQNKVLDEAIRFSSAAAAISVGRKGAQTSIPYLNEIEAFLKK